MGKIDFDNREKKNTPPSKPKGFSLFNSDDVFVGNINSVFDKNTAQAIRMWMYRNEMKHRVIEFRGEMHTVRYIGGRK